MWRWYADTNQKVRQPSAGKWRERLWSPITGDSHSTVQHQQLSRYAKSSENLSESRNSDFACLVIMHFCTHQIFIFPFLLLTLTQTVPHAPKTPVSPFKPQGKVWVRVSSRKGKIKFWWVEKCRITGTYACSCTIISK